MAPYTWKKEKRFLAYKKYNFYVGTNLGRRFRFWFLYRDAIDAYGELDFRSFRAFALLELLIELQLADRFFNDIDAFGLIHLCAAQILKY